MSGLFFGCEKEKENFDLQTDQKERFIQEHQASYADVLRQVNDWLTTGCEQDIWEFQLYCDSSYFKVDDLVLFNSEKTRLVGVITEREKVKDSKVD